MENIGTVIVLGHLTIVGLMALVAFMAGVKS